MTQKAYSFDEMRIKSPVESHSRHRKEDQSDVTGRKPEVPSKLGQHFAKYLAAPGNVCISLFRSGEIQVHLAGGAELHDGAPIVLPAFTDDCHREASVVGHTDRPPADRKIIVWQQAGMYADTGVSLSDCLNTHELMGRQIEAIKNVWGRFDFPIRALQTNGNGFAPFPVGMNPYGNQFYGVKESESVGRCLKKQNKGNLPTNQSEYT